MVAASSLVAVITGGGTGFGLQQALALHEELGATVIVVGRREQPLKEIKSELERCHTIAGDVASLDTWKRIAYKLEHELGGQLHFLGNNAAMPDPGPSWDQLEDPQTQIIYYNTVNVSSIQLSYHFLCPFLTKGAVLRGKPSVVINMSSCASVNPRAFCHQLPTYTPAKCAVDAITRCSYGLYKDQNILSYGLNPVAYDTPILAIACENLKLDNPNILVERYNPRPAMGNPKHIGELAVALVNDPSWLEAGCSYNVLPLTKELSQGNEPQSILVSTDYAAANIHSTDMLAQMEGWANMKEAHDQKGTKISPAQIARIRAALWTKIADSRSRSDKPS